MLVAYFLILTNPSDVSAFRSAGYEPIATTQSQQFGFVEGHIITSPRDRSYSEPLHTEELLNHSLNLVSTGGQQDGSPGFQHSSESATHLQSPSTPRHGPSSQSSSSSNSMTAVSPLDVEDQLPTATGHTGSRLPSTTPSWDTPSWVTTTWEVPQHHTEPTSINTLLAATDPEDPDFVPPFRESEEGVDSGMRRVYRTQPNEALSLREKLSLAQSLLVPFMVPLFLVYVA